MNVHYLLTEMWEHFNILQIFDTAINFYNAILTSAFSNMVPKMSFLMKIWKNVTLLWQSKPFVETQKTE